MENKLVSGGVPLLSFAHFYFPWKKKKMERRCGWRARETRNQGYRRGLLIWLLSFGNAFRIKLDMTFSRLPVEKYFLISEGALGKWNSLATRLAGPGCGGKTGSHTVQCTMLHRICRIMDEGLWAAFLLAMLHLLFSDFDSFKFRRKRCYENGCYLMGFALLPNFPWQPLPMWWSAWLPPWPTGHPTAGLTCLHGFLSLSCLCGSSMSLLTSISLHMLSSSWKAHSHSLAVKSLSILKL